MEERLVRPLRLGRGSRLGQHFGVDLLLEGMNDVVLGGELAAQIGQADARSLRDVEQRHVTPAALLGKIERGAYGLGTFGKIVEHGRTPCLRSYDQKRQPETGNHSQKENEAADFRFLISRFCCQEDSSRERLAAAATARATSSSQPPVPPHTTR